MAYRNKRMHTYTLTRSYVPRPINHANPTGRPEPNPVEISFSTPTRRPLGGSLHQLRLVAFALLLVGLIGSLVNLFHFQLMALSISLAVTVASSLVLKFIERKLN